MKQVKILMFSLLLGATGVAQAAIIDFVKLTQGPGQLGESAWETLTLTPSGEFSVNITGTKSTDNDPQAYAYLDWNHAGLGVCGDAYSTGAHSGSGTNQCAPGSDDNVTTGEVLSFIFDRNVVINKIWLNNTHDRDFTIDANDLVNINGTPTAGPGNGYATGNNYNNTVSGASVTNFLGSFSVAANTAFTIGFNNQQFYVSGMDVSAVPEPGTLGLLGLGLLGLVAVRRSKLA